MSSQSNPIIGKRSSLDQLEEVIGEIQAILDVLTAPELESPTKQISSDLNTWITPSFRERLDDIKSIEEQMQRIDNDVNGNPRYVLHYLAFDEDYATAKEIANSLGWSVYRAKTHGGCFVGQVYSKRFEADAIAKAKARHAEAKGGAQ